ncbi:coiled-coil domain-containing protein 22 [Celeribacter sp. PS-C1]|uniref:coiled-coil domain-containing protein 22 n=1 Tax=Celeribacter sp. PS-C1 TaxID=2820813 RepID=UPI001CA47EE8|nr:coiled-coil domain-containing protein 22 [Celeribacter sp. PS-C1]MBW6419650.1 coiled-coil domain-containing protein 22 [Celeribacter sp. PS-C1]
MTIKILNGVDVSFPYELKDAFRQEFPSAKWNSTRKEWRVRKTASAKLATWVRMVEESGLLEEIRAQQDADLTEAEIRRLRVSLSQHRTEIERTEEQIEQLKASVEQAHKLSAELDEMKDRLERIRAEKSAALREATNAQKSLLERLRGIIDVSEIEILRSEMLRDWRQLKSANSARFKERQTRLREIREDLAKAGLECCALDKAVAANFNRPDRDKPDLMLGLEFRLADDEA